MHGKVGRKLIFVRLLTSTRSSNTDGGGTSTNELGGSINISVLDGDREWAKLYQFKNNSKYTFSRFRISYRTAVRVASLGAERTTRFMFNF